MKKKKTAKPKAAAAAAPSKRSARPARVEAKPTRATWGRIALVAFDLPGDRRSPVAYAARLAGALEEQGAEVHLFCNVSRAQPGWHHVKAAEADAGPVSLARGLCASAAQHLARVSHEGGAFGAMHAIQWSAAPAVLGFARRGPARVAVSFLDTVFSRHGHVNGSPEVAQVRHLEQEAADLCPLVFAGSIPVQQELAWLYGRVDTQVQTADPLDPPGTTPPAPALRRVAFSGTWDAAGGADLFLETARLLREQDPTWRFSCGEDVVSRVRLEADLRRRGQAALLGAFDVEPTSEAALERAAVALVPARQPYDCTALHAAWRAGRPAVVARTGPRHEVEEGINGLLAFPFARSLADAILAAVAAPSQLAKWGAAGRAKLENQFTWPSLAARLGLLYREFPIDPVRRPYG